MELTEAALTALAHRANVPASLHDGLIAYILTGRRTGQFLRAILENDLYQACARADEDNRYRLYDVVFFLTNYAPSTCWRSPAAVAAWLEHGGARALTGDLR